MCNFIKAFCLILYFTTFFSCNYADSIRRDTIKKFEKSKSYMVNIAFEGQIIEKIYCEKCELNKCTLKIRFCRISEKSGFIKILFPPYYEFENDSILNIIVSKKLFEQVQTNDSIRKEKESFNIKVGTLDLQYLSKEKNKWLP